MGPLTGILYGLLTLYGAGWYLGKWSGNFSLLLFTLTVVTMAYWLAERFVFLPRRLANVLGIAAAIVLSWMLLNGLIFDIGLKFADSSLKQVDSLIEPDVPRPSDALKTGSSASPRLLRAERVDDTSARD